MIHAALLQGSQQVDERFPPEPKPEMNRSRCCVAAFRQVDIERLCEGFESIRRGPGRELSPLRHEFGLSRNRSRVRHPAVALRRDPFERLAAASGDEHGESPGDRFGDEIDVAQRPQRAVDLGEPFLKSPAEHDERIAKSRAPFFRLEAERGKLDGPVARGEAQNQTAAGELIDRCRRLGHMQRMPQRKDNAARGQRDPGGMGREISQIDPWIVDLPDVAERRIMQRYVAHP